MAKRISITAVATARKTQIAKGSARRSNPPRASSPVSHVPTVKQALSVRDDLRLRIERCELMPSERLKFEELRSYYNVSIGALREELTLLESEGVVFSEKNKGFQVSPVSVRELLDLTDLRIVLERRALAQSIDAGQDDWEAGVVSALHLLTRLEAQRSDATVLDPLWSRRHREFHMVLLSACPSEWTLRYCKQLMNLSHRYICLSVHYRGVKGGRSFGDHERLAKLALARDTEQACDLLERHFRATTDAILKAIPDFQMETGDVH